jgi:hypothetical protein
MDKTFENYIEIVKEDVYTKQRQIINEKTFLEDIKECKKYLEIIKKMKENIFFPINFIEYLEENLYSTTGKYSLLSLDSANGNNSWIFMAPELKKNFYLNFLQIKSWIEKIKDDGLINEYYK